MVHNLWRFSCPTTSGSDDLLINPAKDPNLGSLGCKRVLVCVAEKDLLKDRGWYYKELLEKSGWGGVVEVIETEDEVMCFICSIQHVKKLRFCLIKLFPSSKVLENILYFNFSYWL
ncbi:hypothetical protein P8452_36760 [Trifolium repens]|nr:hypothetical protein P8452_36760 [Trifolium repens]